MSQHLLGFIRIGNECDAHRNCRFGLYVHRVRQSMQRHFLYRCALHKRVSLRNLYFGKYPINGDTVRSRQRYEQSGRNQLSLNLHSEFQ